MGLARTNTQIGFHLLIEAWQADDEENAKSDYEASYGVAHMYT
jgi:hypothetical protein